MTPKQFKKLKDKSGLTWQAVASELGVTVRAAYLYANGSIKIGKLTGERMKELGR